MLLPCWVPPTEQRMRDSGKQPHGNHDARRDDLEIPRQAIIWSYARFLYVLRHAILPDSVFQGPIWVGTSAASIFNRRHLIAVCLRLEGILGTELWSEVAPADLGG